MSESSPKTQSQPLTLDGVRTLLEKSKASKGETAQRKHLLRGLAQKAFGRRKPKSESPPAAKKSANASSSPTQATSATGQVSNPSANPQTIPQRTQNPPKKSLFRKGMEALDLRDKNLGEHREQAEASEEVIEQWNEHFDRGIGELRSRGGEDEALVKGFDEAVEKLAKAGIKLQGISPFGRKKKQANFELARDEYQTACQNLAEKFGQEAKKHNPDLTDEVIAGYIAEFTIGANTHVNEHKLKLQRNSTVGRIAKFLGDPTPWKERSKMEKFKKIASWAITGGVVTGVGLAAAATGGALAVPGAAAVGALVGKGSVNIARGYLTSRGRDDFYSRKIETVEQLATDIDEKRNRAKRSLGRRAIGTVLFAGAAAGVGAAARFGTEILSENAAAQVAESAGDAAGLPEEVPEPPSPVLVGKITDTPGSINLPNGENINYTFDAETHTLTVNGQALTFDEAGQPTGNTEHLLDGLGLDLKPKVEQVEAVTENWSSEALDVHAGEGGFDTLQQMGVPTESRDALWRAVQDHLKGTGVATNDPNSSLAWLASPNRDFTPEELQYIADTANDMGIPIDIPNITEAHDAVTGFDVEYTGDFLPTMTVNADGLKITGVIDAENHVLHTVIGDLPLTEANDALQLDDMNISVADYSLNSSDFAPGEDFATAHFGMDEINRNVHFRQGAAWDGTAETIPTVSEQDVAMMSETTDGIMDAVAYNYTVDDTSLGDEGITMVMGHNGWENGSFKGLDDAYAANPNSQFTVTSTSGDKIYTYEFVYHNSPEHGTYNSVLTDLLEKYPNGSHLALQTCPDENSIVVKDVYLAQLTEATTSINFVDANGETISIPGTVDVRNHIFHSGIGDITLTDENKIPADFGDSIITETHNLPSEDAPITSESDVAAPTDGNDIPRRDYWRENRLSSRINTFEDVAWATSLAGLGTGGLATYLADRGRTRSTSATKEPSKDANSPETAEKKYSGKEINGRIKKETLLSEFFKTSKQRKFTEMSERDAEDAISRTEELLGQRRNIYRFQTASERRENMLARNTGYILEQIKRLLPDYTKEDLADNLEKFDIQT